MDKQIRELLDELYIIDPGLKKYEPGLIKIVDEFISARPNTKFTNEFKEQLRAEILSRINEKQANKNTLNINQFTIMNKLFYAIGGAVVCIALVAVFYPSIREISTGEINLASTLQIENMSAGAFGSLAPIEESDSMGQPMADASARATGLGGGGGGGYAGISMGNEADMKMIAPDFIRYTYKYTGEDIELTSDQVNVLKRVKNANDGQSLWSLVKNIKFNGLDFNSFKNVGVQSLSFVEDRDFGYQISMNFDEGSLSVNENWQKWQSEMNNCRDEACYEKYRLSIDDVPSDEEIIALANQFIAQYNFNLSEYGEPVVDNIWRTYYDQAIEPGNMYVPEIISVLYPQKIDGQDVYEENGADTGVRVNVNIRYNKVSGIYGLFTENYQSSSYEAETDISRILKVAEQGGRNYYNYGGTVEELSLGTPQVGYMRYWKYENNLSEELLVPALIFPILDKPENSNYYYMQNIVVPLVKDVLDQPGYSGDNDQFPEPMPLPVIRDGEAAISEPAVEVMPETDVDSESLNQ